MKGQFSITADPTLKRWIGGLGGLTVNGAAVDAWRAAGDIYFSSTQELVHVLSGDLRRSGRSTIDFDKTTITNTITYGGAFGAGGQVNYALYEIRRGGSHDFVGRALTASAARMTSQLVNSVQNMLFDALKNGR